MITFTKQEKIVLVCLAAIILCGSTLQYIFKRYPRIVDIVNVIDSDWVLARVDINRANKEELISVPYIGEYTADKIIEYRREKGEIKDLEELKNIKGIREKNYKRFARYLRTGY